MSAEQEDNILEGQDFLEIPWTGYLKVYRPTDFSFVVEATIYSPLATFPAFVWRVPEISIQDSEQDELALMAESVEMTRFEAKEALDALFSGVGPEIVWKTEEPGAGPIFTMRDLAERLDLMYGSGFEVFEGEVDGQKMIMVGKPILSVDEDENGKAIAGSNKFLVSYLIKKPETPMLIPYPGDGGQVHGS